MGLRSFLVQEHIQRQADVSVTGSDDRTLVRVGRRRSSDTTSDQVALQVQYVCTRAKSGLHNLLRHWVWISLGGGKASHADSSDEADDGDDDAPLCEVKWNPVAARAVLHLIKTGHELQTDASVSRGIAAPDVPELTSPLIPEGLAVVTRPGLDLDFHLRVGDGCRVCFMDCLPNGRELTFCNLQARRGELDIMVQTWSSTPISCPEGSSVVAQQPIKTKLIALSCKLTEVRAKSNRLPAVDDSIYKTLLREKLVSFSMDWDTRGRAIGKTVCITFDSPQVIFFLVYATQIWRYLINDIMGVFLPRLKLPSEPTCADRLIPLPEPSKDLMTVKIDILHPRFFLPRSSVHQEQLVVTMSSLNIVLHASVVRVALVGVEVGTNNCRITPSQEPPVTALAGDAKLPWRPMHLGDDHRPILQSIDVDIVAKIGGSYLPVDINVSNPVMDVTLDSGQYNTLIRTVFDNVLSGEPSRNTFAERSPLLGDRRVFAMVLIKNLRVHIEDSAGIFVPPGRVLVDVSRMQVDIDYLQRYTRTAFLGTLIKLDAGCRALRISARALPCIDNGKDWVQVMEPAMPVTCKAGGQHGELGHNADTLSQRMFVKKPRVESEGHSAAMEVPKLSPVKESKLQHQLVFTMLRDRGA